MKLPCQTCDATGLAYAHSTSPQRTECRECSGERYVDIPDEEFMDYPGCAGCGYDQDELTYGGLCRRCDEVDAP